MEKLLWWIILRIQLAQVAPFIIATQCRRYHRCSIKSEQPQRKGVNFVSSRPRNIRGGDTAVYDYEDDRGSYYESSASITKGIVSYLTSAANAILGTSKDSKSSRSVDEELATLSRAPTSPDELLRRIRKEYVENNYLWTGNLDTSCFTSDCTFTDPTLSFVGVDNYVKNVGNLVPIVNYLLGEKNCSRSDLLDITLNVDDSYIQTRWNMVGELDKLFWKPKIDVIGRTKFWYQTSYGRAEDDAEEAMCQVYFYDEKWEIPAGLALLQLVTKAGTINNTGEKF
jgi:hypothetical protein